MERVSKKIVFIPTYSVEGFLTIGTLLRNDFGEPGQEWDIFPHVDSQDEPGQYFLQRTPMPNNEPDYRLPLFNGYTLAPVSGFANPGQNTHVFHAFMPSPDVVQIELRDNIGGNLIHGQESNLRFDTAIVLEFFPE